MVPMKMEVVKDYRSGKMDPGDVSCCKKVIGTHRELDPSQKANSSPHDPLWAGGKADVIRGGIGNSLIGLSHMTT